ncbi:MAG TPA: GNAT family N-acetyltransferase [Thermoanaerobaculia bacterium]|nr:GNAT family N-acetyltransferase [Thermoanaerobaculia bacterium]
MRLRPYRIEDAEALAEAARESAREVSPWGPWCHPAFSLEEARTWVAGQVETWAQRTAFEHCIVDGKGRYLGGCGLNQIHFGHGFANLGYWVRTSATGRGVATEAVRQLVDFARRETDLVRLELVIAVGNHASTRVAEKAGAHFEGILRARLQLHGLAHDARMYSFVVAR